MKKLLVVGLLLLAAFGIWCLVEPQRIMIGDAQKNMDEADRQVKEWTQFDPNPSCRSKLECYNQLVTVRTLVDRVKYADEQIWQALRPSETNKRKEFLCQYSFEGDFSVKPCAQEHVDDKAIPGGRTLESSR